MPRLFAPDGVVTYSHNGHTFDVGEDGSVDVAEEVAVDLRNHGFKDEPAPPSDTVVVRRTSLIAVLEKAGVAVSPEMGADKLAAALDAAVAPKKAKETLTIPAAKDKPPAA